MENTTIYIDNFDNVTLNYTENITDYMYDFEDSVPLEEFIPVAFVYGTTLLLGVSGNFMVIFTVLHFQRMKTITNTFLVSLASADLMLILFCVPSKFAGFFSYTWKLGGFMCKAVHYIQNVSAVCSVYTMTAMSLERYYAIIHPVKSKYVCSVGRAKRVICAIWFASAILASPIIIGRYHHLVGTRRTGYWCIKSWGHEIWGIVYEIYMFYLILLIPLACMSFAYINICMELWNITHTCQQVTHNRHHKDFNKKTSTDALHNESSPVIRARKSRDMNKNTKQVVKMLVAILVIFIISWAPLLVNNILVSFGIISDLHVGVLKPLREAFYIMAYFNSCVNPVVYCFMSKNFKESFRRTVFGCLRGKKFARKRTLETRSSTGWNHRDTAGSTRVSMHNEAIEMMNCQYGTNCNSV